MAKKPPSRINYELSHPLVTTRVDMETFNRLQERRQNGQSYADILRIGLDKQEAYNEPLLKKIEELELEALELEELVDKRTVRVACYLCGKPVVANCEEAKEVCRKALKGRIRHSTCPE